MLVSVLNSVIVQCPLCIMKLNYNNSKPKDTMLNLERQIKKTTLWANQEKAQVLLGKINLITLRKLLRTMY